MLPAISTHLSFLDRHEPALHHAVEYRKEFLYFFFCVYDLDHNGQVCCQLQQMSFAQARQFIIRTIHWELSGGRTKGEAARLAYNELVEVDPGFGTRGVVGA